MVSIRCTITDGKKPFRFFNMWIHHPLVFRVVASTWRATVHGVSMYKLVANLKMLKQELEKLNKTYFYDISSQVDECKKAVYDLQIRLQQEPMNEMLMSAERKQVSLLKSLMVAEESFYKQKARIQWLKVGDCNT